MKESELHRFNRGNELKTQIDYYSKCLDKMYARMKVGEGPYFKGADFMESSDNGLKIYIRTGYKEIDNSLLNKAVCSALETILRTLQQEFKEL